MDARNVKQETAKRREDGNTGQESKTIPGFGP